ncbi:MAG TPA: ABC transporter permease [Candidatus Binatia bacterium]|nr:ABC transporter permease [Candidatus Binatia bacterium]
MATVALPAATPRLRSGPVEWLRSCAVMARWQLASLRLFIPMLAAVEVLAGVGFVLGFGLFFTSRVPATSVVYCATGVPVITLYIVGLVFLPQVVGMQKLAHTYEFLQSEPVPRSAGFVSWYAMNLLVGVPGMVASLIAGWLRFGVSLHVSAAVIPATLLVCLTSSAIGFAMGHAVAVPMVSNVLAQVLNFVAIGFSPIAMPAGQLPDWLASLNRGLPFGSMGTIMRSALGVATPDSVPGAYALLAGWTCAGLLLAAVAVMRRG